MSKDVKRLTLNQQETSSIQDEITDPNLFATKAIKQRIKERHLKFQAAQIYTQALLSLVTAPFVTTHVSLQLSVIPHKNLYGDVAKQDSQALAKISKEITVQDRRKFELLVKSGASGTNQPFRAPIYGSYAEVWRGLSNQGFLGFYKGNFLGLAYTLCNSSVRFSTINMLDYSNYTFYHKGGSFIRGSVAFLTSSLIDMVTQPLQTLQSRFILQNRLPNFCLYRSILEAFKKHKRNPLELYRGWMGHALKNAVLGVTWGLYDKNNPLETYLVSTFFSHLFSYPIFTAIRRIQCQSSLPGMIPKRYGGTIHALRLIAQEEGIQGLYRGFIAYAFVTSFMNGFILLSSSFLNSAIEE